MQNWHMSTGEGVTMLSVSRSSMTDRQKCLVTAYACPALKAENTNSEAGRISA